MKELSCAWCGKRFLSAKKFEGYDEQKCSDCVKNNASRGSKVFAYARPRWLTNRLEALIRERAEYDDVFDHWGRDSNDDLVAEPYATRSPEFDAAVAALAVVLGARYSITTPSWHAPYISDCLRVTFFKPEGPR